MLTELRDHQVYGTDLLRRSLKSGYRRPLLSMPVGSGKTLLATYLIERALAKGKRVLFTVPAIILIEQTAQAFWKEGIRDIGIIQGTNHPETDYSRRLQIASVQTLQRRIMPKVDLAIVDEAHVRFEFYRGWFKYAHYPIIGMSATPWGPGLGELYDDLLIPVGIPELQRQGFLVHESPWTPDHPDLSKIETVAGDYHKGQLSDRMREARLVGNAVHWWKQKANGLPTFTFGVDCAHAKALQQQFLSAGIPTGYIDAHTERDERRQVLTQFRNGELRNVVNVACLTMGVDEDVRCISLNRPTKSEILFVQMIGRGLRPATGKEILTCLDHTDTYLNLGYARDIYHEHLDNGEAAPRQRPTPDRKPKECPACHYVKEPYQHECPKCGFAPTPQNTVVAVEGDLSPHKTGKHVDWQTRVSWYAQFLGLAESRGYKKNWARCTYKLKFGEWPEGLPEKPEPPQPEALKFAKYALIRNAKKRDTGHATHA